jgi:hypothetical protein
LAQAQPFALYGLLRFALLPAVGLLSGREVRCGCELVWALGQEVPLRRELVALGAAAALAAAAQQRCPHTHRASVMALWCLSQDCASRALILSQAGAALAQALRGDEAPQALQALALLKRDPP